MRKDVPAESRGARAPTWRTAARRDELTCSWEQLLGLGASHVDVSQPPVCCLQGHSPGAVEPASVPDVVPRGWCPAAAIPPPDLESSLVCRRGLSFPHCGGCFWFAFSCRCLQRGAPPLRDRPERSCPGGGPRSPPGCPLEAPFTTSSPRRPRTRVFTGFSLPTPAAHTSVRPSFLIEALGAALSQPRAACCRWTGARTIFSDTRQSRYFQVSRIKANGEA